MLLVAAMHGGAHIIKISGLDNYKDEKNEDDLCMNIIRSFSYHESMVYGASWIVSNRHPDNDDENNAIPQNDSFAATCSFYDQKAFIWKE